MSVDKIRELAKATINEELVNALCDVIDMMARSMERTQENYNKRIAILEETAKKKQD
jgi:hypothetical protein